ncbi:MAG: nitroreductase family deazaflavin-dependent oxidoreductase [Chloroflexi bacterium]|nr:MAG: nitroreductase family deazaflavin-dependent oxidoreductase [Chloroflexota bacterium]
MRLNRWLERTYAASSTRPARRLIRAAGAIHRLAIISTGGRIGADLLDHPILLLRTIGRRSGKLRTQPLMYLQEADCYVVAASFGGHDQDPAWLTNIRATPQATIMVAGREIPVLAAILERRTNASAYGRASSRSPQRTRSTSARPTDRSPS